MEKVKIFAYGTLRKGSKGHRFLQSATLLAENQKLKGFRMYDNGFYPFVIPVENQEEYIVGEIYEIPEEALPQLDHYEGVPSLYKRTYLESEGVHLYISQATDLDYLPVIEHGDWRAHKSANE